MSATLGGLIKDYRLQKNISQLEIAFAMGWKEPSRLSRIEQGRVGNPSREFLDKLIAIMKLTEEEKNDLLYTGNYLPTDEDIRKVRIEIKPVIDKWPYPATVYDFSWRVILANEHSYKFFYPPVKFDTNKIDKIPVYHILEQLFHPKYPQNIHFKGVELEKWHQFLLDVLVQFKHVQRMRMKDNWYTILMKKMMNNVLFRNLWAQAQIYKHLGMATNFFAEPGFDPLNRNTKMNFYDFGMPFFDDPRFELEYEVPADIDTMKYFQKAKS